MVNEKVDFDLSLLTLEDLVEVYNKIDDFIKYLDETKIVTESEGDDNE